MNPEENFKTITFHPALEFYFKAGGASVEFDAAPGDMTFARIGVWNEKMYMVIVKGKSVELPPNERKALDAQTNPTWPHLHARLECTFDEFIKVFPCNHVIGIPDDRVNCLNFICEISGITPVVLGKSGAARARPIWEIV
jgi:L-fucose isomerase